MVFWQLARWMKHLWGAAGLACLQAELNVQNCVTDVLLAKEMRGTLCLFKIFLIHGLVLNSYYALKFLGRYVFGVTPSLLQGTMVMA